MTFTPEKRQTLDAILHEKGYTDYKWIDPKKIIVSQWVRRQSLKDELKVWKPLWAT